VLGAIGFGFVEVGTVTASAQAGNPKPRLFRLMADRAIVNRMGFNNHGAAAAAARLQNRKHKNVIVGVNIGKTKVASDEIADYVASARAVREVADYVVVNVSSPNTPGLRDLQAVDRLGPLLTAVRKELGPVPLLVKIAPDLADEDVDAVADLAVELGLDGIIATNTTISRDGLKSPAEEIAKAGAGGLSGPPLKARSLHILRRLRDRADDDLVLIAAGGIDTPDDAWERLRAGATLVQAYTGFVYGGPFWPRRVNVSLARRARAAGLGSLAAIASKLARPAPLRRTDRPEPGSFGCLDDGRSPEAGHPPRSAPSHRLARPAWRADAFPEPGGPRCQPVMHRVPVRWCPGMLQHQVRLVPDIPPGI
jgi:dihydroorotate dehydrogenase